MTEDENRLLTRCGPDTDMGRLLRLYWLPAIRSARLQAGGAPQRIQLLGERFVAYRDAQGRPHLLDEACPHRCASLALARNEGDGLRCIFHGWKVGTGGSVVDVPTVSEPARQRFAQAVPVRRFHVHEAAGILWACLKQDGPPPPFPTLEFTLLPLSQVDVRIARMHCNWVQAMESVLDSAHLGQLHQGQLRQAGSDSAIKGHSTTIFSYTSADSAPTFEIEPTAYGFREAAIRRAPDGRRYVQIREFVAPCIAMLPAPLSSPFRAVVISVPIDDEWCSQWFIHYSVDGPFAPGVLETRWRHAGPDRDNFYDPRGGFENLWGQDREAMAEGHFSGFPGRHFFDEDFIVQESMGPIVDRRREFLCQSDRVIAHTRKQLMTAALSVAGGGPAWGQAGPREADYALLRSGIVLLDPGEDWREVDTRQVTA